MNELISSYNWGCDLQNYDFKVVRRAHRFNRKGWRFSAGFAEEGGLPEFMSFAQLTGAPIPVEFIPMKELYGFFGQG